MRGNLVDAAAQVDLRRSIPACAGEPRACTARARPCRVYPRVCGGTGRRAACWVQTRGLSPRVRGNHHLFSKSATYDGLSPRVRGNRRGLRAGVDDQRSIPACAGEPLPRLIRFRPLEVYPRVCGGTTGPVRWPVDGTGLSPRVRGNLEIGVRLRHFPGSIPACAGEPLGHWMPLATGKVYPRVCGGTGAVQVHPGSRKGLSPRVRGNQLMKKDASEAERSIPACAGEPFSSRVRVSGFWVYPRVCGGTVKGGSAHLIHLGLSPRVRGNRQLETESQLLYRSIPACAGEPARNYATSTGARVYPRVCGGTYEKGRVFHAQEGLSPRVRGNRIGIRI